MVVEVAGGYKFERVIRSLQCVTSRRRACQYYVVKEEAKSVYGQENNIQSTCRPISSNPQGQGKYIPARAGFGNAATPRGETAGSHRLWERRFRQCCIVFRRGGAVKYF